ncbi:35135_t:CDS:2, partial [Gigaspora margarita]
QHKILKHVSYNLLPNHIQQIPESELNYLRNAIIKELQKKLKNYYYAIEKQVFLMHCSENAFVEEDTVKTIGLIFNNDQWYKRDYSNDQYSFVQLYSPEKQNILETSNKLQQQKKIKKLSPNREMTVE